MQKFRKWLQKQLDELEANWKPATCTWTIPATRSRGSSGRQPTAAPPGVGGPVQAVARNQAEQPQGSPLVSVAMSGGNSGHKREAVRGGDASHGREKRVAQQDRPATVPEVAKFLRVRPDKVLSWIRSGRLRGYNVAERRTAGRSARQPRGPDSVHAAARFQQAYAGEATGWPGGDLLTCRTSYRTSEQPAVNMVGHGLQSSIADIETIVRRRACQLRSFDAP